MGKRKNNLSMDTMLDIFALQGKTVRFVEPGEVFMGPPRGFSLKAPYPGVIIGASVYPIYGNSPKNALRNAYDNELRKERR